MKDDFASFLDQLRENPWMGTDLGQGLHKIRLSITSKGKGKSGGARVITLVTVHTDENDQVLLLAIYDKSERENLSDKELKDLLYPLNPQLHSRSATYIKRNGLLIRKTAIKSLRPFQCAYYPLTPQSDLRQYAISGHQVM